MPQIDTDQARALLDAGQITQEQHDQFVKPPEMPMNSDALLTMKTPEQNAAIDAEEEEFARNLPGMNRKGSMENYLLGKDRTKVIDAQKKDLNDQINVMQQKEAKARKLGFKESDIAKMLEADRNKIMDYEDQISRLEEGGKAHPLDATDIQAPPSDGQAGEPQYADPNMQLASFNDSTQMQPGGGVEIPQSPTLGQDLQTQGLLDQGRAAREKAAAEVAYYDELGGQMKNLQMKQEAERMEESQRLDEAQKALDDERNRVKDLKIDSNRYWANQSTGNKIVAALSLFLSGYASAMNGGPNYALKAIEGAINRDIDEQRANIENQKDGIRGQETAYANMYRKFKDNDLARSAATASAYEKAELELRKIGSRFQGQEQQGKVMQALGVIQEKKDAAQAEFKRQYLLKESLRTGNVNPEMLPQDMRDRYVPGFGLALNKEDATKLKDKVSVVSNAKNGIKDLLQLSEKSGSSFSLQDRASAETIAQMLIGNLRTEIVGPGAMNESELKLMNDLIADPTKIMSLDSTNKTRLQTLMRRLDSSVKTDAKARGMTSTQDQMGERESRYK